MKVVRIARSDQLIRPIDCKVNPLLDGEVARNVKQCSHTHLNILSFLQTHQCDVRAGT